MKIATILLVTVIAVFKIQTSHSWGDLGHQTAAYIATQYLNKNAINHINEILDAYVGPDGKTFKTIMDIAIYPDYIRQIVPWADSYHYVNMRANDTKYNRDEQCKPDKYCIVEALFNYTGTLKNSKIKSSDRLGEALAFTVHFMGDICQPLHAGNIDDLNGNLIKVTLSNEWKLNSTMRVSDLHWTWDHLILVNWMLNEGKSEQEVWNALADSVKADQSMIDTYFNNEANIVDIINDSRYLVLKHVYNKSIVVDYNNVSLKYYTDSLPVVKTQLMKSGLRMARLLNDVFEARSGSSAMQINLLLLFLTMILVKLF